ncbi:MAG: cytochrome c oxidase subunit II [Actinomycetota bacterium]|nr:cytochrome c oxidase subunit II [Actinomycetota bacterium]
MSPPRHRPERRPERPRQRSRRVAAVAGLALVVLAVGGCSDARWGVPESAATQGDDFLALWRVFVPIAGLVVLLIWGLVAYLVIRGRVWRRRPGEPDQEQYHVRLEVLYTVVPLLLVGVLFGLTVVRTDAITETVDDPDEVIEVYGFQWSWRFTYPDDGIAVTGIGEGDPVLRLPVDRTIRLHLLADDVIHSFWVPEFLTKRDLIPGVDNEIDITPTRTGTFTGRCAEFCGLDHTEMRFGVEVMEADEYDAWIADAAAGRIDDPTVSVVPVEADAGSGTEEANG